MFQTRSSMPSPGLTGVWPALGRFARVLIGLALVAGAVLLGLLLAAGLLLRGGWVLLAGRRAPQAPAGRAPGGMRRGSGEVVDIEAREIPSDRPQ
ncbi:MAG TPA: hypothetical protein VGQ91_17580 [Ideonella sp.]|jgi:hypothetical protein|nr:hypothetical protein [Ideonella sp.]